MIDVRKSTVILINFVDYVIEFNAILPTNKNGGEWCNLWAIQGDDKGSIIVFTTCEFMMLFLTLYYEHFAL